jgi:ABC-type Fe3+ transport system permease subunit
MMNTRRLALLVACVGAAAFLWMTTASLVFAAGAKVGFYPLLWLDAVLWWWPGLDLQLWRANWFAAFWIVIAGIWASVALAAVGALAFYRGRFRGRRARPLYGATEWASREERKGAGIRRRRWPS